MANLLTPHFKKCGRLLSQPPRMAAHGGFEPDRQEPVVLALHFLYLTQAIGHSLCFYDPVALEAEHSDGCLANGRHREREREREGSRSTIQCGMQSDVWIEHGH